MWARKSRRSRFAENKPYACVVPGCGKRFFHTSHLSRHRTQEHRKVGTAENQKRFADDRPGENLTTAFVQPEPFDVQQRTHSLAAMPNMWSSDTSSDTENLHSRMVDCNDTDYKE